MASIRHLLHETVDMGSTGVGIAAEMRGDTKRQNQKLL
jgi:hypothetical protein